MSPDAFRPQLPLTWYIHISHILYIQAERREKKIVICHRKHSVGENIASRRVNFSSLISSRPLLLSVFCSLCIRACATKKLFDFYFRRSGQRPCLHSKQIQLINCVLLWKCSIGLCLRWGLEIFARTHRDYYYIRCDWPVISGSKKYFSVGGRNHSKLFLIITIEFAQGHGYWSVELNIDSVQKSDTEKEYSLEAHNPEGYATYKITLSSASEPAG